MNNFFKENVSLAPMTTLGIGGNARFFITISNLEQLPGVVKEAKVNNNDIFVLGEGSNVVISDKGFSGLVIRLLVSDVHIVNEDPESVVINVGAGRNWDSLVSHTVDQGWWGLENMSLIPGSVGACPVQNVGAYGQECKNVIYKVHAYDIETEEIVVFDNESCNFKFRESIFNTTHKDKFIITNVEFKLSKVSKPILTRPEVRNGLKSKDLKTNSQHAIRDLVISYRTAGKALPNNPELGSAGTFFRTTVVSLRELIYTAIKSAFKINPKIALIILLFGWRYRDSNGYRVPSRMLIDACDLIGYRSGEAYLYKTNSAVMVTNKNAEPKCADVLSVIKYVRKGVYYKTGFKVPIEPTLVGFDGSEILELFSLA